LRPPQWEDEERADYRLDVMRAEFLERLYGTTQTEKSHDQRIRLNVGREDGTQGGGDAQQRTGV
jgi:hypothetical protein